MKDKHEIIEFAKELYLTPDEKGNHKYSLRDISTEIAQKLHTKIAFRTIGEWAKKYGWDKLWERAVKEGITNSIVDEGSKTKEEQLREAIANKKKQDFEMNADLRALAYTFIKEHGFKGVRDALSAFEIASKNLRDIQIIEDSLPVVKVEFIKSESQ